MYQISNSYYFIELAGNSNAYLYSPDAVRSLKGRIY